VLERIKSINPWIAVFVFVAFFHWFRGAQGDASIFTVASVILILEATGKFRHLHPKRVEVPRWLIVVVIALVGAVLYVSPRHSVIDGLVTLALLPIALYLVWYPDVGRKPKASEPIRRAKYAWFYLILAMSLIELFAFYASQIVGNDFDFPTISIILDGPLDTSAGRLIWIVIWALAGVALLRIWRRKK